MRRVCRPKIDMRSLDAVHREMAYKELGLVITGEVPKPDYGIFSGPLFQNLSNRIPYVRDMEDGDGTGIHTYGQRTERKYTRTGAYLYKEDKPNTVAPSRLLSDIPHCEDVDTFYEIVDGYATRPFRVFIDMKSGTVHAIVSSYNKTALSWYRRYFSLLPAPISEISSKDATALASQERKMLTADGTPVCWLPRDEFSVFIRSSRMPIGDKKCVLAAVVQPMTFTPTTKNGIPSSIDPHYVLAYNFRYGSYKQG
jgi:hypothetical protein